MKKWIILILMLSFFSFHNTANANVYWDGAEVVKDQTGKLTFSKDVKVYKRNVQGEFDSLVVPKGNFFRVYAIEKYNGQTYYWMSSGYRVQKTDLVIFKEVPFDIRRNFYKNPVTVNISHEPVNVYFSNPDANIENSLYQKNFLYGQIINLNGSLTSYLDESESRILQDATDVRFVEKTAVPHALYYVKEDTISYDNPLGAKNANTRSVEKNMVVESLDFYYIVNGYMQIVNISNDENHYSFIPMSKLEKATGGDMYYVQQAIELAFGNYPVYLKRNDQVEVIATYKGSSFIFYKGEYYKVDSDILSTVPAKNVATIFESLTPTKAVQHLSYYHKNYAKSFMLTRTNNTFSDGNLTIQYEENDERFIMKFKI